MMNRQASFGSFSFEISNAPFNQLRRVSSSNWSKIKQLGVNPALQFTGSEQTISLTGETHSYQTNTTRAMKQLRSLQDKPHTLILYLSSSRVENLGLWVLNRVEETLSAFSSGASAHKVVFSLELSFYGWQYGANNAQSN